MLILGLVLGDKTIPKRKCLSTQVMVFGTHRIYKYMSQITKQLAMIFRSISVPIKKNFSIAITSWQNLTIRFQNAANSCKLHTVNLQTITLEENKHLLMYFITTREREYDLILNKKFLRERK